LLKVTQEKLFFEDLVVYYTVYRQVHPYSGILYTAKR